MTQEEIEKLVHTNQRLSLILGYAMGSMKPPRSPYADNDDMMKYRWIIEAIENVVYLDKPLPPMP